MKMEVDVDKNNKYTDEKYKELIQNIIDRYGNEEYFDEDIINTPDIFNK